MAQLLAALATGVGVASQTGSLPQVDTDIVVGDIDTAMPLQGMKVVTNGRTVFDISNSQPLMQAIAKFGQRLCAGVVGMVIRIATGRLNGNTNITFINNGATTPIVYASSQRDSGVPIEASQVNMNLSSSQTFTAFGALFVTPSNSVASFDVVFADGTQQNMLVPEADALFSRNHDTEVDGRLSTVVTSFDNRAGQFKSVKVNSNSTAGGVNVAVLK